jgi:hypothetical protein
MVGSDLSLRELALLTWKLERPMKEAERLELKARYLEAVRRKLIKMFGQDFEIRTAINEDERVTAQVDDLRFSTFIYNEEVITIIPVVTCPSCEREVFLGAVNDLAELGEALEAFNLSLSHECQ